MKEQRGRSYNKNVGASLKDEQKIKDGREKVEEYEKLIKKDSGYFARVMRYIASSVFSVGPVPQHIAFIMDGNRRFAKKKKLSTHAGHKTGFFSLENILAYCIELGVKEVSVYAFSIDNFKRSQEEVRRLLELATVKFRELLDNTNIMSRFDLRINVVGNIKLLPKELQIAMAKAVILSQNNTGGILNVCFSYTSRDEMTTAANVIVEQSDNLIPEVDVTNELIEKCLYLSSPVDLMIRTSGERRLSDFLLWQGSYACTTFLDILWPELTGRHLYKAMLVYQANAGRMQERRQHYAKTQQDNLTRRLTAYLQERGNKQQDKNFPGKLAHARKLHAARVEELLHTVSARRHNFLEQLAKED